MKSERGKLPSRGWIKAITLWLVVVALWGGQTGWYSQKSLGLPSPEQDSPDLQARAAGEDKANLPYLTRGYALGEYKAYMPYLTKGHTLGPSILGIDAGNLDDEAKVRKVVESGAKWVRVPVYWSETERQNTSPAEFDWSKYDAIFAKAAQSGLSVMVVVTGNPSWAADTTCGPVKSAALQEMAQYLTALVGRYSKSPYQVKYWELYNEPDNGNSTRYSWLGGCWGNNGREYGQMLQVAYPAIKAADPQARVVFGSLAYDWFSGPPDNGPFVRAFLDDALDPQKGNAGPFFDVFGFHYYYLFAVNWELYGKDLVGKANYLRDKLASYGLSKPMLLTEVGQPSGTSGEFQGSDDMQSTYVVQAFVRSMAANMQIVIWFSLTDYDGQKMGLLENNLSSKPSYDAFKTLSEELWGAVYRRPLDAASYPGIEGYVFSSAGGAGEKWVLWASGNTPVSLSLPALQVRVVSKLGVVSTVSDDADGQWNGKVPLTITTSPIFLQVQP